MEKRRKKHHFVPKVLQKAFEAEERRIWYAERGSDGIFTSPEVRNTDSTFKVRDLYTIVDVHGEPSDAVERLFYGEIDDYLGKMIPHALDMFSRREAPEFSGDSLDILKRVVFQLIKRTPDFSIGADEVEVGKRYFADVIRRLEKSGNKELLERIHKLSRNDSAVKKFGRSIRVQGMIQEVDSVNHMLKEFVARWAVIHGKASFILSSQIAYRIGNGGSNGIKNPKMEIWLPISPKHALVLLRDPNNQVPLVVNEIDAHVRLVNEYAVENSSSIASHSERLLLSLLGRKYQKR